MREVQSFEPVESYPIEIVPYDPRWRYIYQQERDRLLAVIGDSVASLEHMGSTSVPGLSAKPIIDISAALKRLEDAEDLIPRVQAIGYRLIPQRSPDRFDLWNCPEGPRPTHILHFMQSDSDAWRRPLIFRNALRADPELRMRYSDLKSRLAAACGEDIRRYGAEKSDFILSVVDGLLERS
jgi:GrpB-like predicted nucleotidyltransferase (UPF0157 family)